MNEAGHRPDRSLIIGLVEALMKWRAFLNKTLPPPEQAFCERWFDERNESIALVTIVAAIVFHGASLFIDPLITKMTYAVNIMLVGHLSTLIACCTWLFAMRPRAIKLARVAVVIHLISLSSYIVLLSQTIDRSSTLDISTVRAWTALFALSIFQILILPTHGWRIPAFMSATLFSFAGLCWSGPYLTQMMPIASWAYIMAALVHMGQTARAVAEARREYQAGEARSRAEGALVAHELDLAREIQDSLMSPAQLQFHGLTASCFQRKYSEVSGDWAAMRVIDDELIVIVADAAGKGIQAALVIQAVQALWAGTLGDQTFDPLNWLTRLNQTLTVLGEKKFHMVTMGLLRLTAGGRATYWSAGHLPVFLVEGGRMRRIHSRGTPLGLDRELTIDVAETTLGIGSLSILLGSDGAFNRGTLTRNRDVVALRNAVRESGIASLDAISVEDDKTLIWIERDLIEAYGEVPTAA